MVATSEILVADPQRYRNQKAWWTALHKSLLRAGNGAQAALAARAGCSGGHLHNVLRQVKPLNAPLDRTLPLALGLPADALSPDRLPMHGEQYDGWLSLDGQDLLPTLSALAACSGEPLTPSAVAAQVWPGTGVRIAARALASLRPDAPPCTASPMRRVLEEERAAVVRQLREASLALLSFGAPDRQFLASICAAPMVASEAVAALVARFQSRWFDLAQRDLSSGGPFRVARVGVQLTPVGRPITPDLSATPLPLSAPAPDAERTPEAASRTQDPESFNVFAFRDIVQLTESWLAWKQRQLRHSVYTWRWLADRLGCGPSDLTLIRKGARGFGLQRTRTLVRLAGWTGDEAKMVELLGRLSEASTLSERGDRMAALFRLEGYRQSCTLEERSAHATMDLAHLLLFERCAIPGGLQDAATAARELDLGLSEQEIAECLNTLDSCRLVARDADQRWRLAARHNLRLGGRDWHHANAPDPSEHAPLTRLHIQVLEAIAAKTGQEAAAASLTLPVAQHRWAQLRDETRDLRNTIGGLFDQYIDTHRQDAWRVYLLTTQCHTLSVPSPEDSNGKR